MRELRWSRKEALGVIALLLFGAQEFKLEDGFWPESEVDWLYDILDLSSAQGPAVVRALIDAGYLDTVSVNGVPGFRVHEWPLYNRSVIESHQAYDDAQEYERRKKMDRIRQQRRRGTKQNGHVTSRDNPVQKQSKDQPTQPKQNSPQPASARGNPQGKPTRIAALLNGPAFSGEADSCPVSVKEEQFARVKKWAHEILEGEANHAYNQAKYILEFFQVGEPFKSRALEVAKPKGIALSVLEAFRTEESGKGIKKSWAAWIVADLKRRYRELDPERRA